MTDPSRLTNAPFLSSPMHSPKSTRDKGSMRSGRDFRSDSGNLPSSSPVDLRETNGNLDWLSALSSRQPPPSQDSHLPTPQSYGTSNMFPFFPTAISSPESPLAYARSRTLGGTSNPILPARMQACIDSRGSRSVSSRDAAMEPRSITPRASPVASRTSSPASLPAEPHPPPNVVSPSQEQPVLVKAESPPPVLEPAYNISSNDSSRQDGSSEAKASVISLSSPFVEKPKPITTLNNARRGEPFQSYPTDSPSMSVPLQPITLSSPAYITEKQLGPNETSSLAQSASDEPVRQPGGELDRIRSHLLEAEEAHRTDLEHRRPEYLKRLQQGDDIRVPSQKLQDIPAEKNNVVIMETPARGRRLQLFDFQETSAESFEESLMTHGYGTYGEPRTPHRPLAATEGLSKEAMDWLAYNTPAAVPSSIHSHLVPDVTNEKELKKRKRLEAFRGSFARARAKLYPAEVEGFGRVLLNVPPEDVDELVGSPAKKRATGRRKRGTTAAERRSKMQQRNTPVHTEGSEPHWLDKEVPWCLREKEREEEMKAQDAERMRWIDNYFAHDTTDEDSDKNEEDGAPAPWDEEADEPSETVRRGRGKAVPIQANPNRKEVPNDAKKTRSLFFPTDPADARTALMSKRNVRRLAHRKLRQNGQRPAFLRGYGDGKLACACGQDEDDGLPAVQCDDCYNWHHLECIGVRDEAELGEEDDPWFCPSCTAQSEAAISAADWRNQRQPTFVPTDERPVHTSTRNDVAFYSSSPLRDWDSSGSLHTPVQRHGRLPGSGSSESLRRSIWDDSHPGPGPSTPLTTSRGVQIHTPGTNQFDPMVSPRSSFPKFGVSFTTPKNSVGGSAGFTGLLWPPQSSGGLFATPTPRGRGNTSAYGFNYGPDDPNANAMSDAMYATDDTPIRRAAPRETRETRPLGLSAFSSMESPLVGRGGQSQTSRTVTALDGNRALAD
ncbi:hypothetical protein ACEPAI_1220 [Sanghuangporus weigelae]